MEVEYRQAFIAHTTETYMPVGSERVVSVGAPPILRDLHILAADIEEAAKIARTYCQQHTGDGLRTECRSIEYAGNGAIDRRVLGRDS